MLAVSAELTASNGAYAPWPYTAALDSGQASENVTGPYDIPAYERHVRAVVTNKTPMGPYRGVGRVIAAFAMERMMDELAARLDIDPLEIRRRNVVRKFPHATAAGLRLESGDYVALLGLLEKTMGWTALRAENARLREQGLIRGAGAAFAVEQSAYGAQALGQRNMAITPGYDTAAIRMESDGRVRVAVGLHNHGQGHETTIAQIAAEELGLSVDDVSVVYGDTEIVPYGMGTWASRSTVCCGGATILAAAELRDRIIALAADMLEASPADLRLCEGNVVMRGSASRRVSIADVARRAIHEPHRLPDGVDPGLEVTRQYMPPEPGTFASSVHGAHVEIEPETGQIRVLRYVVAEDCGTMVNPMIVDGQIHGGVAQGIGGALLEHLAYDEQGTLVTTSLMDYLLPTAVEVPAIEVSHQQTPSPFVPGGFKGMGEGGAINAPVAIVAAVNDALAPLGIVANHTPLTPETEKMLGEAALRKMKPTAWLINTARGGVIDTVALAAALRDGQLAGACLDVLPHEPPPMDDALFSLPNVIFTPHSAFYSEGSLRELQAKAAQRVVEVLEGRMPPSIVNPSVLEQSNCRLSSR